MSSLIVPLLAAAERAGLAASVALFVAGLVVGLGFSANLGRQFIAGLVILGVLCGILALLQRVAANTRRRVTAGKTSYRAFFDHAMDGIFRTTPDGRYLAVNQALCDIYGYPEPEELIAGLTDIGAQLYIDPGRRELSAPWCRPMTWYRFRLGDLSPLAAAASGSPKCPCCTGLVGGAALL